LADNGGLVSVRVSNSAGFVDSAAVALTVGEAAGVPASRTFVVREVQSVGQVLQATLLHPVFLISPAAKLDYAVDWRIALTEAGDSIGAAPEVIADGCEISGVREVQGVVVFWVEGVPADALVPVTCRITTAGGRVDDRTLVLQGVQR
jgi:hypothetical protein